MEEGVSAGPLVEREVEMRAVRLLSTLATLGALVAFAAEPDPIRVHLRTGTAGGLVAPGAEDSMKDLAKALRGRAVLDVVPDEKSADVVLQVESRAKEVRGQTSPYVSRNSRTGQAVTVNHAVESCVVYVKLVAGRYEKVIEGTGDSWSRAAKDVANQAEGWITLNQARLRQLRAEAKP
jgi:hypothetical protein